MKKIIKDLIHRGFNEHTGYSYYATTYYYGAHPFTGFVLCQNYTFFWIPCRKRIDVACDKMELNDLINTMGIDAKWSQ